VTGDWSARHAPGSILLRCGLAAALIAAAPAAAQGVVCCNQLIDVKGGWIGAGRRCNMEGLNTSQRLMVCEALKDKMCPDVEKYCVDPCDMIDRLKGRMRGLNEAIKAHQKGLDDSQKKRHAARDELWGKGEGLKFEGGSIAGFGQAMLDSIMLAGGGGTGVGKAVGKARGAYSDLSGWAKTAWGLGSDPGNLENWSEFGTKILEMEADAILKKRSSEAIQAMNQHFAKTGNFVGAQNVYRQRYGNYGNLKNFREGAGKVTGGLSTLANLYDKTNKVANDLQNWIDSYRDMDGAEKEIAKAEAERERLQEQLSKLLKQCKDAPKTGLLPEVPYPGYDLLLGRGTTGAEYLLLVAQKPAAKEGEATYRAAQQAMARLRGFQNGMNQLDKNVGQLVFSGVSPWLARVSREAKPRELLVHLMKEQQGELDRLGKTLSELESWGSEALKALQAIPPDRK
jgi:hypothetical protein